MLPPRARQGSEVLEDRALQSPIPGLTAPFERFLVALLCLFYDVPQ
jgi:hypothetical protein